MKIFKQLFIILSINLAGELLTQYLHLPVPGPITGMVILLTLLITGVLKEHHIRDTADFMLQNMSFFFIPASVSIIVSYHALEGYYFQTVLTVVVSTVLVLACAALATELLIKLKERRDGKHN